MLASHIQTSSGMELSSLALLLLLPPCLLTSSSHLSPTETRLLQKEYLLQQLLHRLTNTHKQTIMVSPQNPLPSLRRRRSSLPAPPNPCSTSGPTDHCCTDSVEVDFESLGWDFILSPRSLQFNYCRGSCAPRYGLNNNNSYFVLGNIVYCPMFQISPAQPVHLCSRPAPLCK